MVSPQGPAGLSGVGAGLVEGIRTGEHLVHEEGGPVLQSFQLLANQWLRKRRRHSVESLQGLFLARHGVDRKTAH